MLNICVFLGYFICIPADIFMVCFSFVFIFENKLFCHMAGVYNFHLIVCVYNRMASQPLLL